MCTLVFVALVVAGYLYLRHRGFRVTLVKRDAKDPSDAA